MSNEKLWVEFCVRSDIRNKLISIRLDNEELELEKLAIRNFLGSIVTCIEYNRLFVKKMPIYLKDVIAQISQEIKIESNPDIMRLYLDREADNLVNKIIAEVRPRIKEIKPERMTLYYAKDEREYFENLKKKASLSELDKSIIANIDRIESLVYLFKGQTILRNSVFFDLFQHWFDMPYGVDKIDELIYQLKKKADLIKTGPRYLLGKDKIKLITRYYYLKYLFSALKKTVKEPYSEEEANREWRKLEVIIKRNRYFDIDKIIASKRLRYQSIYLADFLKKDWIKGHFKQLIVLAKYDMTKEEFKDEINNYIREKKRTGRKLSEIRKSLRRYLREQSLSAIKDTEPSELALFYLSIIEGFSKRKTKRVIENNKSMAASIQSKLSSILK